MKPKVLEYFIGKPCSIFTIATNRNLKEENPRNYPKSTFNYFIGIVESVSGDGIMLNRFNKCKSFFSLNTIVSIAGEEVLDPNNPEHAKVIHELDDFASKLKEMHIEGKQT